MSWITDRLTDIWSIVSKCVEFIVGGTGEGALPGVPLLQLFLVAGLIPIGFRIFRSAKRAARR